jgi:UDP-N-acetyl-2-amino-2-deoxyglucuronate dehydrogenase
LSAPADSASDLRLAIAGCGEIARWMAFLSRLNWHIRLVACCDRTLPIAESFAARYHIPRAYADYGAMLGEERPDAVYLAVPHDLHFEMACAAIEAGCPVLVEKPLARTLAEGQEIVGRAQAAGVRVGVNYQYRYDRGCYALAQAARHGDLGELYYARCNVPWYRDAAYFEQGRWRGELARAGGGTLLTQGSHVLDVLLWAMGSPPRMATGLTARPGLPETEVETVALGTVELESGALIQVSSSMVARPEQAVTLELYGERGTALYSNQPLPHVRFRRAHVTRQHPPGGGVHALQRSLEGFRAWVLEGRPYLTPAAEALPVLAAVDALYRSARSGWRETIIAHTGVGP